MAHWEYKIKSGVALHDAIDAEDAELTVKCLIACYRELYDALSDEDRDWKGVDIEDTIFNLENYDEDEDVDGYLDCFYDLCDEMSAWICLLNDNT